MTSSTNVSPEQKLDQVRESQLTPEKREDLVIADKQGEKDQHAATDAQNRITEARRQLRGMGTASFLFGKLGLEDSTKLAQDVAPAPSSDVSAPPPEQQAPEQTQPEQANRTPAEQQTSQPEAAQPEQKEEGGWGAALWEVAEGAYDEVVNHPGEVIKDVAIGAVTGVAIAAAATVAPAVIAVGAAAGAVVAGYEVGSHLGEWYGSGDTVAHPEEHTPEEVDRAREELRGVGEGAVEVTAGTVGGLGGGFLARGISAEVTAAWEEPALAQPAGGAVETAVAGPAAGAIERAAVGAAVPGGAVAGAVEEEEESTFIEVVKHNSIDQVVDAVSPTNSAPAPTANSEQMPRETVVASVN